MFTQHQGLDSLHTSHRQCQQKHISKDPFPLQFQNLTSAKLDGLHLIGLLLHLFESEILLAEYYSLSITQRQMMAEV